MENVNLPLFALPGPPCFLPEPSENRLDPSLSGSVYEISGPHGNYNNKTQSTTKPQIKPNLSN